MINKKFKMSKLLIHHNTGFGDHLICNGLVNFMSIDSKVYLICNKKNLPSIKYLYTDNKNVQILPLLRNNKLEKYLMKITNFIFRKEYTNSEKLLSKIYSILLRTQILYIGFDEVNYPEWDKSFYKSVGLDFSIRYDYFELPNKKPFEIPDIPKDFVFIQDTSSQGKYELKIDTTKEKIYLSPSKTNNFFDNLQYIYDASEIHCIDSSLVHLIESILPKKRQKIFFHDVERYNQKSIPDARFNMRHNWKIVKYKETSSFY